MKRGAGFGSKPDPIHSSPVIKQTGNKSKTLVIFSPWQRRRWRKRRRRPRA